MLLIADSAIRRTKNCSNSQLKYTFFPCLQFCQIDAARMPGGLNDALAVYLMCAARGVPVCPHAGKCFFKKK